MKRFCKSLIRLFIFGKNGKKSAPFIEISGYWNAYGGFSSVIISRWMWLAIIITISLYRLWLYQDWTSLAFNVLPSLLGFSIGAMAIIFAFPSTALFKFITWEGNSYYLKIAARFAHFVLMQLIAIILALFAHTYCWGVVNFLGFLFFMYALTTGAATVFSLFGMAQLYNKQAVEEEKNQKWFKKLYIQSFFMVTFYQE